ncbi:unnamed protein product [Phytophthora lilii]|uniref:Unnamed protein product n=1 Tax=Phytophthora lilii TaxID=2077276 RepID=A0A9W6TS89_9STRA|nr:unnamed protein product [Phytophthora lilii]
MKSTVALLGNGNANLYNRNLLLLSPANAFAELGSEHAIALLRVAQSNRKDQPVYIRSAFERTSNLSSNDEALEHFCASIENCPRLRNCSSTWSWMLAHTKSTVLPARVGKRDFTTISAMSNASFSSSDSLNFQYALSSCSSELQHHNHFRRMSTGSSDSITQDASSNMLVGCW